MTPTSVYDDILPPVSPATALRIAALGAALCAVAAFLQVAVLLNLLTFDADGRPAFLATGRLLLVATGALAAGGALSWRPDLWQLWGVASGTAWLASVGIPEPKPGDWDSMRLLARVLCAVCAAAAVLILAPAKVRYTVLSAFAVFHFGGILAATTWPDTNGTSPPWIVDQTASRVYLPYYKFLYLSNAYHFYSPEPGPASHLYFLVTYELTARQTPTDPRGWTARPNASGSMEYVRETAEWIDVPNRRQHYKDPLGLTYYRRLSLTEMVSQAMPSRFTASTFEKSEAVLRRRAVAVGLGQQIPLDPQAGPEDLQYRIPREHVPRYLLPSYSRHIAAEFSGPGQAADGTPVDRGVKRVKVYRVEHTILTVDAFIGRRMPYRQDRQWTDPADPYHPTTYKPYFLGEYDGSGVLTNPTDPMLYWLCPVVPRQTRYVVYTGPGLALASDGRTIPRTRKDRAAYEFPTREAAERLQKEWSAKRPASDSANWTVLSVDYDDYMSEHAGFVFDWEGRTGQ